MKPMNITLDGFQSSTGPVSADFSGLTAAAITGHNGAGKSTLIDALVWALTGEYRTPGMDGVINTGCDKATVTLVFDMDATSYRIVRVAKRTKTGATQDITFDRDDNGAWTPAGVADKSVTATQAAIDQILGVSASTLLATAIARQGDIGRFTQMKAAERKALLWEMLELDVTFGPLHQAAKDQVTAATGTQSALATEIGVHHAVAEQIDSRLAARNTAMARMAALQSTVDSVAAEIDVAREQNQENEYAANRLTAARKELETLRDARASKAAQQAATVQTAARAVADTEARRATLLARHDRLVQFLTDNADIGTQVTAQTTEVARLEQVAEQLLTEGTAAKVSIGELQTRVAQIDSDINVIVERVDLAHRGDNACFTCGQPMDTDTFDTLIRNLDCDRARLVAEMGNVEASIGQVAATKDDLTVRFRQARDAATQARARLDELNAVAAQLDERRSQLDETVADINAARLLLDQQQGALDAAQVLCDELNEPTIAETEAEAAVTKLDRARRTFDLAPMTRRLEQARHDHQAAIAEHARADSEHQQAVVAARKEQELAAKLTDLQTEVDTARVLEKAFGRDGAPALIMEGVCTEIAAEANRILDRLSGGALTVGLSTRNLTRSGSWGDKLTVTVYGPDGERPIESFSGGERLRVDIALRAALTMVLFARKGARFGTFIADEGWGALDADGINAAVDALTHLTDHFDLVLTVTHIPAIAEAMPAQIIVSRTDDRTDITVN